MPRTIKARYKLRSGTTAEWAANDEVLADAEVGEEVTPSGERLRKIGNGIDKFSDLPYRINLPIDRSVPPDDNQTLVYNASTGLLEWSDGGGIASIETEDSQGIALTGNGTPASKLKATPIISAVTGNKLSVKSDGLFTDAGGIHIDNRVSTYANLPSPPTEGTGATYLVKDGGSYPDNLLYVWDGTSWDAEGDGAALGRAAKAWRLHITDTNGGNYNGLWTVECGHLQFLNAGGDELSLGVDVFATYGTLAQPVRSLCGTFFGNYWADDRATSRASIDSYAGYRTVYGQVDKVAITARGDSWNTTVQQFHPRDFTVQSSTDTTTGFDGTWADEWSVTGVTGWTQGGVKTFVRP